MTTVAQALAISEFLSGPGLFPTPLTPGEKVLMQSHPLQTLNHPEDAYWFSGDDSGHIQGVIGTRMHANATGIFEITAIAVSPDCRYAGIGHDLFEAVVAHVRGLGHRGIITDTSADPSYTPMHHLLEHLGFSCVGRFPDFYYPGEDTLWYYLSINKD